MPRPKLIVLLSGEICTGKSTLAQRLEAQWDFVHLSTREFLKRRKSDVEAERQALQNVGDLLDQQTRFSWVREELTRCLHDLEAKNSGSDAMVIVDSVRNVPQIEQIRESYGSMVVHVHLDCREEVLAKRYEENKGKRGVKELDSFAEAKKNATEADVHKLKDEADICIQTDRASADDVVVRVASYLGLYGREHPQNVDVIVGGQFGSEGKGQIAAFLAREYSLLVRVGGPNAGHKVFELPEPFTFHQLPSGTRSSEARLLIGPGAALEVKGLLTEIGQCHVDHERLSIDPRAIIIQPRDIEIERRTIEKTIGSTARGVGEAMVRRVRRRGKDKFAKDIPELRPFIRPACEVLEKARANRERVLLEGTQGTGLSLYHGHYPYVTSRDTTVAGCLAEAGIPPRSLRRVVMVCRTYPIRVQSPENATSGPMSPEVSLETIAERSQTPLSQLKKTERTSTTNRERRVAEFDWHQIRRSTSLNGPTDIALTFVDYLHHKNQQARRLDQLTTDTILFIEEVERVTGTPVSLISTRFHSRAIIDRRTW